MGKLKSSFVLKQYSKNEKQVLLYLNFGYKEFDAVRQKHSYKPLRYYTGIKVKTQEWDVVNKRPHNTSKLQELLSIEKNSSRHLQLFGSGRKADHSRFSKART